ncbi:MAG: hypothetical protein WCG15_01335 [Actinomycetes bacterium]
MATPTGALPSAAPFMIGGDDQAKTEYYDAIQKTLAALEARANQGPNWFQVAGAVLNPGRTGNAFEGLSNASNVIGAQQEKQSDMQLPIAQMRAQLAGQKYEVENQGKALQLLSATLGVAPAQVETALASGTMTPDMAAKLAQIYPMIAQLSPKVAEIVKGTFNMQNELGKSELERKKFDAEEGQRKITNALADRKEGMNEAELIAKYGADVVALMPGGKRLVDTKPAPAPQAALPGAAPAPVVMPLVAQQQASQMPTPAVSAQPNLPAAPQPAPAMAASSNASGAKADLGGVPLAVQGDVQRRRIEEADKPWVEKRAEILSSTPQMLSQSNTNLRQLHDIATRNPQIFALMQEQGLLSALATAAQEGAQLDAGTFRARLGLPVKQFLEKVRLEPEDQQKVRDVTRILASEFLSNVKANKGLLGINPTDNDARLLAAPMVSSDDSSKAVQLWSKQQLLMNKQRAAMYTAYDDYIKQAGAYAPPRQFFAPGSVYEKIVKDYEELRMQIYNQFNPK